MNCKCRRAKFLRRKSRPQYTSRAARLNLPMNLRRLRRVFFQNVRAIASAERTSESLCTVVAAARLCRRFLSRAVDALGLHRVKGLHTSRISIYNSDTTKSGDIYILYSRDADAAREKASVGERKREDEFFEGSLPRYIYI